jgi:osmotically-inducible protein OsmY
MDALATTQFEHVAIAAPGRQAIARVAEDRLRRSGYLALRDVSCDAREGVVYLRGRLPAHYLKQVAQALAAGVEGVCRVVNLIEVATPARPGRGWPRNEPL